MTDTKKDALSGASRLTDVLCMDAMTLQKRSEGPTPFGAGVTLAEEEHEQKRELCKRTQLFVAQLKLYRQSNHGVNLDCAGVHANWWMVGFGGYEERGGLCRRGDSWPPNGAAATASGVSVLGLTAGHRSQFLMHNDQGKGRAR